MIVEVNTGADLWKVFSSEPVDEGSAGEYALNFQSIRPLLDLFPLPDEPKFYHLYLRRPLNGTKEMMRGGGDYFRAAVVPQRKLLAVGKALSRHVVVKFPLHVEYLGTIQSSN